MPRRDGTGPMGHGPMTGKGTGCCARNAKAGGFGPGRGRGGGHGWSNMLHLTGLPGWMRFGQGGSAAPEGVVDERLILRQQAEALTSQLERINQRLNELGAS